MQMFCSVCYIIFLQIYVIFYFLLSTERLQNTVLFLIVFRKSQRAQKTKILGSHDIEVVTSVLQNV
jgi:hypothetical protein